MACSRRQKASNVIAVLPQSILIHLMDDTVNAAGVLLIVFTLDIINESAGANAH